MVWYSIRKYRLGSLATSPQTDKTKNISNLYSQTRSHFECGNKEDDAIQESLCHCVTWHTMIHHTVRKESSNFEQQRI